MHQFHHHHTTLIVASFWQASFCQARASKFSTKNITFVHKQTELQKRANRASQLVLFFLAGANFWEKRAKNCAIMSMAHITYAIAH